MSSDATTKIRIRGFYCDPKLPQAVQDWIIRMWDTDMRGDCPCGTTGVIDREQDPPVFRRVHRACAAHAGLVSLLEEYGLSTSALSTATIECVVPMSSLEEVFEVPENDEAIEKFLQGWGLTGEIGADWPRDVLRIRRKGPSDE